jgi:hypothetical protein
VSATVRIAAFIAADVDGVLVEAGPTAASARAASAAQQHPIDRAHFPDEDPAVVAAKVEAWAAALPVVCVELHGDAVAVRAVLLHLAVEVPRVFMLPGVRAALDAGGARPG